MTPTFTAAALLVSLAAASPQPSNESFLEEALFAGGARDRAELDRLVTLFHRRVDPMVAAIKDQSNKQIAAQLLLRRLHLNDGDSTAVLGEYEAGAFSINQALETGKFNCLSASMIFILAARMAGIQAEGERYWDHARPVVTIDGRDFQVEPTSVHGWDVPENFRRFRYTSLTTVAFVEETPTGRGDGLLVDATWAWANEPRDARWAARVIPTPPPLISAFTVAQMPKP